MFGDLQKHWVYPYFSDSLDTLQDVVRSYDSAKISNYYARTLVFVQSSGMGKSRLADSFGESCPMINFVFRRAKEGFPLADSEVLEFVDKKPENFKQMVNSPNISPKGKPEGFPEDRANAVWNHCIAVGLLQASLEICKLPTLITKSHMLIRLSIY